MKTSKQQMPVILVKGSHEKPIAPTSKNFFEAPPSFKSIFTFQGKQSQKEIKSEISSRYIVKSIEHLSCACMP